MVKKFQNHLFWIIPLLMIIGIITLLFWTNLNVLTKQPNQEWSRNIKVGETQTNRKPFSYHNGKEIRIAFFNEGEIHTKTYSESSFELLEESSTSVPFTKWDPFYYNNGQLIYHGRDGKLMDAKNQKLITKADEFHPLNNRLFYVKGKQIFELDPQTKSTTSLGSISDQYETIVPMVQEDQTYFMAYKSIGSRVPMALYKAKQDGSLAVQTKGQLEIPISESFRDISVATHEDGFGIVAKSDLGKNEYRMYTLETSWENPNLQFQLIELKDPETGLKISQAGEVNPYYTNGQLHVLFHGIGFTQRETQGNYANNIYQFVQNESDLKVQQISNTRRFSTNALRLTDDTILWLDYGITKHINIASKKPELIEKADRITQTDLTLAFGSTIMYLVKSFTSIYLAYPWIVVPLLFFVILFFTYRKAMDQNYTWVLYAGVGLYLVGAMLLESHFFVRTMQAQAPDFLTFPGYEYVYILVGGVLAYLCLLFVHRTWSVGYKIMYFVALHLIFLMLGFGGYIL